MRRLTVNRVVLLLSVLAVTPLGAQQRTITKADYDRAARMLAQNLNGLVIGGSVSPNWLPGDRFWYRNVTADGYEFILIDPARRTRAPVFDHVVVARILSSVNRTTYDPKRLPFQQIHIRDDGTVTFLVDNAHWGCSNGARCKSIVGPPDPSLLAGNTAGGRGGRGGGGRGAGGGTASTGAPLALSPDGKRGAFVRDWNLWVRDIASGQEKPLTRDGVTYFGYATDNAGWSTSDRAMVSWSADGKKIATQQQDERNVREMYLMSTNVGHPILRVSKFPLPGDSVMAMLHHVIIDVDAATVTRVQMPPDYHRGTLGDDIRMSDYVFSPDASKLAIASVSRDHKKAWLSIADVATGSVRKVLEETVATQYEARSGWQVLWPTNELIWYSERDNWGHLYLYDLDSGRLKNRITSGEGPVMQIVRLDEANRTVWFGANGREPGQDPYFRHFYRIGLDGSNYVSLTPDDGNHEIQLSPSGRYLIDTYSKPDVPPVVTLRDASGKLLLPLERADISRLLATGWKPPQPIKLLAGDGKTDIYGLLFKPTNFDPARKYPIINHVYPGPQTGSTGSRSFTPARSDRQALAELGFIVVTIDGTGTPGRSKAFQDAYYGAMGRHNTIPDQIAGMKQLAQQYAWIDLERTGIWGHSGGGFATTTALFRFPDFFKVGIAESGNHDQRTNEDDWGERYQGLVTRNADGTDSYDVEANQNFAKNLKGRLLLAHGTMDTNVPPYQTMLVADALIKANKDFDLLMLPNANHGYGAASNYMMRRRWDYFVKWLLDAEPPTEYEFTPPSAGRGAGPGGRP